MKLKQNQSSTQQQISKPNPPTPEMVKRAQFVDKTYSGEMLVFDLETNGLLNDVTCIHCLVIYDSETDETICYNDQGNLVNRSPVVYSALRMLKSLPDTTLSVTTYLCSVRFTRGSHQPPWL